MSPLTSALAAVPVTVVLVAAGALAVRRRPRHAAMVLAGFGAVVLAAALVDRGGGGLGWTGRGGSSGVAGSRPAAAPTAGTQVAGVAAAATASSDGVGGPARERRSRWPAPRSVRRSPSPTPAQRPSRR